MTPGFRINELAKKKNEGFTPEAVELPTSWRNGIEGYPVRQTTSKDQIVDEEGNDDLRETTPSATSGHQRVLEDQHS